MRESPHGLSFPTIVAAAVRQHELATIVMNDDMETVSITPYMTEEQMREAIVVLCEALAEKERDWMKAMRKLHDHISAHPNGATHHYLKAGFKVAKEYQEVRAEALDQATRASRTETQLKEAHDFIEELLDSDLCPEQMQEDARAVLGRKF